MLLILSVSSQRNDNLDCLENSYSSISRYHGRGYECALEFGHELESAEWEKLKSSTVKQLSEYMADRILQTVNL